jgi:hypothetical protein
MKHYIYGLVDPRDYKVHYVGRTTRRMDQRLYDHIGAARRGHPAPVYEWLRSLLPGQPWLVCLETCSGLIKKAGGKGWRNAAELAEVKWIKRFRRDCFNNLDGESHKRDWLRLVNRT